MTTFDRLPHRVNHINFNLYHYIGNNPIRYLDPDGRMEEETAAVDSFLSNADQITSFIFTVCEAVEKGKPAVESVLSEKFNDLGITEGVVIGFKPVMGDPYKLKQISNISGKFSNVFLGLTIALNFIDVLIVDYKTGGDSEAVTKRFIRNTVTTVGTFLAAKLGASIGAKIGGFVGTACTGVGGGPGAIIGGCAGGIALGCTVSYFLNKKFDDMGW